MVVLPGVFGFVLNHLPNLAAQPIGSLDGIDVERISAGMRNIDIVQRDPEQARRELTHQLPGNVDREFIRTTRLRAWAAKSVTESFSICAIWCNCWSLTPNAGA